MKVVMTMTSISESVNQPWISVIRENDWFIRREHGIEFAVGQAMGMFSRRLKRHQIDDVNDADFDIRKVLPQEIHRGKSLQRRDVASACHHDIRCSALIRTRPGPDADAV